MRRSLPFLFVSVIFMSGCQEEETAEIKVRGLKTHLVQEIENVRIRRFPAVLEASQVTTLSFETGGRLLELNLDVGQKVAQGEVIARIDPASLQLQVQNAQAALAQAEASAKNAQDTFARQQDLFARGATTKVVVDNAETQAATAQATVEQAQASLETAEENLSKSVLIAPFEGIISSVDAQSFSTVSVGLPVASIYPADIFEVAFSVNFDIVNRLVVGKEATVRLADRPDITLDAVVSEIGSRADAVSSFPIVLELKDSHPLLKAGMAVEASLEFPSATTQGYTIPLSAAIKDDLSAQSTGLDTLATLGVFVFDPDTSTVVRRDVKIGGIQESSLLVIDGLTAGERVASAGVSFLRDGQDVKLLQTD